MLFGSDGWVGEVERVMGVVDITGVVFDGGGVPNVIPDVVPDVLSNGENVSDVVGDGWDVTDVVGDGWGVTDVVGNVEGVKKIVNIFSSSSRSMLCQSKEGGSVGVMIMFICMYSYH